MEQTELNMLIKVLFLLFVAVVAVDANVCPLWLVLIVYHFLFFFCTRVPAVYTCAPHVCCSDLKNTSGGKKIVFLFVGL